MCTSLAGNAQVSNPRYAGVGYCDTPDSSHPGVRGASTLVMKEARVGLVANDPTVG